MKSILNSLILLGIIIPAFGAAPNVDFDNAAGTYYTTGIVNTLGDFHKQEAIPSPKQEKHLAVDLFVKADEGWQKLNPTMKAGNSYFRVPPDTEFSLRVRCENNPYELWGFRLDYLEHYSSQDGTVCGHRHDSPMPTALKFPDNSDVPKPFVVNNISPTATYWRIFKGQSFAISYEFNFRSTPCGNSAITVDGDIRNAVDLTPMPKGNSSSGYDLMRIKTDDPETHPEIYWVTPAFKSVLQDLGAYWENTCGTSKTTKPLYYQRMSLPWGGVFDSGLDWKEPYYGLDKGTAVDISKYEIFPGNRQGLINAMCIRNLKVYTVKDTEWTSHYFVTLRDNGATPPPGAIACCVLEKAMFPSKNACLNDKQNDVPVLVKPDCPDLPQGQKEEVE